MALPRRLKALNVDQFFSNLKDLAKRHYALSNSGEFIQRPDRGLALLMRRCRRANRWRSGVTT
ncbi:hypothetical protein [Vibrio phage J14]|nr:hypothetical protein [Vibrio phage J14]